ncbi:MAG: SLC45 family MFS transporter [Anaerolineaceae bacterium]|nr:SLC45 family MFS transporter [Anaerolineaceae bacterium]
MQKKFSYSKIFLLGFGFFGVSIIWSTYNAFVPIFLNQKFGLSAGWVGFFMVLDNIAGLLIQPPVGAFSDRLRTKIGRRLPFIAIGAPISAVAFGFIPIAHILPLFVASTMSLLLSMAFWRTPVVALMPDITPSKYRSQANGIINFMGGVGAVVSYFIGSKLFAMNEAFPFWLGSVLVVISSLLVLVLIKEPRDYEIAAKEDTPGLIKSIKLLFKEEDKSALYMLSAIFLWFVSYNAIEAFFTLYGVNHLGLSGSESAFQLTFISLLFLIFALPSGFIGAKFGRKRTISVGLVLLALSVFSMYILKADTLLTLVATIPVVGKLRVVGLVLMVAGIGWAFININSLPMIVDMTEDARIGTYTGLYYFASTLAAITGPIVFGQLIQHTGNNYNLMMLISPIFIFLAIFLMSLLKKGEAKAD